MEVREDAFHLYAGGGYTKDSDPQKEWEETTLKIRTLESVLEKSYICTDDIE